MVFSAFVVFFAGLLASSTSVVPLARRNTELGCATFEALLENRQIIVEEFLRRAQDVSRSVTSRTRARHLHGVLNRGEDGAVAADLRKILQDGLDGSMREIGVIIWLDNQRQSAASVGLTLPSTEWIIPGDMGEVVGPLLRMEDRVYVLIAGPIMAADGARLGTSLLLFSAVDLENLARNYTGLGRTGELILGSVVNETAFHFFPLRNTRVQLFSQQFPQDTPMHVAMKAATARKSGTGSTSIWNGADHFYRYVSVHGSAWRFVLVMEEDEMFAYLYRILTFISALILVLFPLTARAMLLMLRPLTGRLLLLGDELAGEVARSNEDLTRFAYVISHDLQEPVRMIASYLKLIERRVQDKLDPDSKEFFAFAVDGAKRMQTMITALLAYSRVTSKDLNSVPFRSEEALAEALLNLQLAVEESAAEITHGPLPLIQGDAP